MLSNLVDNFRASQSKYYEQEVKKYYHEKFRNCDVENLGRN